MEDPPRRSLEVEPAPVDRRRSSLLPMLVSIAAAAFVLAAIVKPWEGDAAPGSGRPSGGIAATSARPSADALARSADPGPTPMVVRLGDDDILAAATRRSTWGVRAVVVPSDPVLALAERWTAIDDPGYRTEADTRTVAASAPVAGERDSVVALGVTTPPDALPIDMRFWRMDTDGIPQRVAPIAVPGPDPGSWLWRPALAAGLPGGAWLPGTYRIDVLLGRSIDRIVVVVPGDPDPPDRRTGASDLPADLAARLGTLGQGLFVIAGDSVVPVDALATDAARMGERAAWLSPGLDLPEWAVGRVFASDIAAVGVILPPGAVPTALSLDLISPIDAGVVAPELDIPLPDGSGRTAAIIRADTGGPFAAGTYRVWAGWRTADDQPGSSVRYLEIAPPGAASPSAPVAALRQWAPLAERPGRVDGEPVVTDADLRPSGNDGTCGDRAFVKSAAPLLGMVLEQPGDVVDIRLTAPDGYTSIETRAMLPLDDGLALVALPPGGLIPGRYRIDVTWAVQTAPEGTWRQTRAATYDLCLR